MSSMILRQLKLLLVALGALGALASAGCTDSAPEAEAKPQTPEASDVKTAAHSPTPEGQAQMTLSKQTEVDAETVKEVQEGRGQILEEAATAIRETENALRALASDDKSEALPALERATGKLEVLLARKPGLALAPTSVHVETLDVLATLDGIEEAVDQAEDLLGSGRVQEARALLATLASETRIRTTHIPLASYPAALKAASVAVEKGQFTKAQGTLLTALNALVITDVVIPLPIVRAGTMFGEASLLADVNDRRGATPASDSQRTLSTRDGKGVRLRGRA